MVDTKEWELIHIRVLVNQQAAAVNIGRNFKGSSKLPQLLHLELISWVVCFTGDNLIVCKGSWYLQFSRSKS